MRDEIAAALRRTGAYLSHLGRLKLGVATSAREEAPLSGVKICIKSGEEQGKRVCVPQLADKFAHFKRA